MPRRCSSSEEALEELLATLPEPRLPAALARRVLRRLRTAREAAGDPLDQLLELPPASPGPVGLAEHVLAGLAEERARGRGADRLDRLLESVPEPAAPAGLAERVLEGLAEHRPLRLRPLARAPRGPSVPWLRIAAAVLALAGAGWLAWSRLGPRSPAPGTDGQVVRTDAQPPAGATPGPSSRASRPPTTCSPRSTCSSRGTC